MAEFQLADKVNGKIERRLVVVVGGDGGGGGGGGWEWWWWFVWKENVCEILLPYFPPSPLPLSLLSPPQIRIY